MNASGLETLDNIWDLFETTLRTDSPYARTRLFEMAKWLEESQNLLDWIEKTPAEKQAWMETSQLTTTQEEPPPEGGSSVSASYAPCEPLCAALGARVASLHPGQASALFAPAFAPLWGTVLGTCLFDKKHKINARSRKRPRAVHKAPQCGGFSGVTNQCRFEALSR